jgi:hypothetical protein
MGLLPDGDGLRKSSHALAKAAPGLRLNEHIEVTPRLASPLPEGSRRLGGTDTADPGAIGPIVAGR